MVIEQFTNVEKRNLNIVSKYIPKELSHNTQTHKRKTNPVSLEDIYIYTYVCIRVQTTLPKHNTRKGKAYDLKLLSNH